MMESKLVEHSDQVKLQPGDWTYFDVRGGRVPQKIISVQIDPERKGGNGGGKDVFSLFGTTQIPPLMVEDLPNINYHDLQFVFHTKYLSSGIWILDNHGYVCSLTAIAVRYEGVQMADDSVKDMPTTCELTFQSV